MTQYTLVIMLSIIQNTKAKRAHVYLCVLEHRLVCQYLTFYIEAAAVMNQFGGIIFIYLNLLI